MPALASLEIYSHNSDWDFAQSLNHSFPDDRLSRRLFSNPPIFEVGRRYHYQGIRSLGFRIGSFEVQFDFNVDDTEANHGVTTACIQLDVQKWKEFFRSHPEVRSVEKLCGEPISNSLRDALSPAGDDQVILCPRLESVMSKMYIDIIQLNPLLICLRYRRAAGFKLRYLRMMERTLWAYRIAEDICPLVEVLELDFPNKLQQKVSSIFRHALTDSQWGRECLLAMMGSRVSV